MDLDLIGNNIYLNNLKVGLSTRQMLDKLRQPFESDDALVLRLIVGYSSISSVAQDKDVEDRPRKPCDPPLKASFIDIYTKIKEQSGSYIILLDDKDGQNTFAAKTSREGAPYISLPHNLRLDYSDWGVETSGYGQRIDKVQRMLEQWYYGERECMKNSLNLTSAFPVRAGSTLSSRQEAFYWTLENGAIQIRRPQKGLADVSIPLPQLAEILKELLDRYGINGDWLLDNNVATIHEERSDAGFGRVIYRHIASRSTAQCASQLGPILNEAGIIVWNRRTHGIGFQIKSPDRIEPDKLRVALESLLQQS